MSAALRFILGGETVTLDRFEPTATLLDHIRDTARLTGTKEGCNEGDCGACTVVLAGLRDGELVLEPANACITLLGMVHERAVITVEDLARNGALHPVQDAMVRHHGSQCGFCTPGIVMSLFALTRSSDRPTADRETVNDWLAGNLCRCTGYRPIVDAALEACAAEPSAEEDAWLADLTRQLRDLATPGGLLVKSDAGFFAAPASEAALASVYAPNPDATLVAGATDVGLWVTKRLDHLPKIIHLGRVAEMKTVTETPDAVTLGAMASYTDCEAAMAGIDPDLGELWRRIGSKQIRASGTVGGNIANGSPIGDAPPPLIALGATITLRRLHDTRTLPVEDYFLDYGKQDRQPGEFVSAITIPKPGPNQHFRCYKISKRRDEDITAVLGAFLMTVDNGTITAARIAYGGMAATPKRALTAERALVGLDARAAADDPEIFKALDRDYSPISDLRASKDYRSRVAANLLKKALLEIAGPADAVLRITPREAEPIHA